MSALWLILPALTHRVPCWNVCFQISSEFEEMWRAVERDRAIRAYSFLSPSKVLWDLGSVN